MLNIALQGIIQGLTEFLPVSSSGHLTLIQFFTGKTDLAENLLTDIALHFGTLLAVIYFFRNDLRPFFSVNGWKQEKTRKLASLIIVASIPTALMGIGLKKQFEALFSSPRAVCVALFITGLILLLAEKLKARAATVENCENLSFGKAIFIGFIQGCAITPGISRSGSTISAGLFGGLNGEEAAKFSFLLMIPAVSGATLLELKKFFETSTNLPVSGTELAVGAVVSAVTGFLALKLLVFIVKKQKLSIFSYYLFFISILSFIAISGK
ncbi:MAG: undecaprenyl-diphosphate phosphatase [Candidatus Rifleibacteriota bacterium]